MTFITLIGLFAAFCTTVAFVPQVVRTWKSRSTEDISLGMFVFYSIGIFSWLVYGVLIHDLPLIASNGVTFLLSLIMLGSSCGMDEARALTQGELVRAGRRL